MRWSCKQTNDALLEILSRLIKWIKTNSLSAVIVFLPLFPFWALTELLSLAKCFWSTDEVSRQRWWGEWWTQWDESEWERLLRILVGKDPRACSSRIFTLEWCDTLELGVAMMVLLFPKTVWFFALPISTESSPIRERWAPGSPAGAAAVLSL